MSRSKAKSRYRDQIRNAVKRGIKMIMSFDEWDQWWLSNGVDKNFSTVQNRLQPCMCRKNDIGDYTLGNVYLGTRSQNTSFAWSHRDRSHLCNRVKTPKGIFKSQTEAAKAYNVTYQTILAWTRKNDDFQIID